jgi:trimeric autotransporter adhesin
MPRPHFHVFLLLSVFFVVLCGCGGFKGILPPTLSSIDPTSVAAGSGDFTLTATGTNFAGGTAILWDGVALPTTVSSATQLTAKISGSQIAAAGAVSIRVMKSDTTTSDAVTLTITGGLPGGSFSLTSISPAAVAAGSPDFTLTATGAGFVSGAAITLNGTAVTTTFDSATQLHATIPAANVASAATIIVGVMNPDKSTTNTLPLTVFASGGLGPAPTLTSISPNTSTNGIASPLTLTATGTNFVSASLILWNGVPMTTTYNSPTQLTATIPTKYVNLPASAFDQTSGTATANVFVLNPDSTVSNELPFTITVSSSTTPVLVTVFNQQGTQRSKVGDPGFTMTLCGSLFAKGAVAYWNGTALPTSPAAPATTPCPATAPQQVTAQVSASMLTAVAEIPITIKNPNSNPSNSIPYYVGMNVYFDESADVVWDSRFNLLYISKPSTAQHSQDSIIAFSTRTGLNDAAAIWIYKLPAGSNPDRLALSADGKYLYVGLDGSGTVQQLTITGATTAPTAGNTINLGTDPQYGAYYALDMQIMPLSNTTIAVTRGVPSGSGSPARAIGGLAIYDNGTQRPQVVGPSATPSSDALLDTLQWSADGKTIYAANNENASGDLYQLPVTASGVTLPAANDHAGIFNIPNLYIHLEGTSGWLYGDDGVVLDPASAAVKGNTLANGVMTPDASTHTAFYVAHPSADPNVLEYYVLSYDLTSVAPGPSLDLYQVQGIPQHLIRWNNSSDGTQGLAFTTQKFNCLYSPCNVGDGRLYIIDLPLP